MYGVSPSLYGSKVRKSLFSFDMSVPGANLCEIVFCRVIGRGKEMIRLKQHTRNEIIVTIAVRDRLL